MASIMYGMGPSSDGPLHGLYTINPTTGVATFIGSTGPLIGSSIQDLAANPVTGIIYGTTLTNLYTINPATGAATSVGPYIGLPVNTNVYNMSFVEVGGVQQLYILTTSGYFMVMPSTAMCIFITAGITTSGSGGGVTQTITPGTFYITSLTPGDVTNIQQINPVTGASIGSAYPLAPTEIPFSYATDSSNNSYGITQANPSTLWGVNIVTGATSPPVTMSGGMFENNVFSAITIVPAACIHGDCLISMGDGSKKMIKDIVHGDIIVDVKNNNVKVERVVSCWLKQPHEQEYHEAIVFEKDSMGDNLPFEKFIIDPSHPVLVNDKMVMPVDVMKEINDVKKAYSIRWNAVAEDYQRYDLLLEDKSCEYYLANGVPVMARKSLKDAGY